MASTTNLATQRPGDTAKPQKNRSKSNHSRAREDHGRFHNPYNFVPAPKRNVSHPELGDRFPIGHSSYRKNCWSGTLQIRLTTKTPLLIPDAGQAQEKDEHKTFSTRQDPTGRPYLPPTSIKGMLRSCYEAITNSRLAIFQGHEDPLGLRMPPEAVNKLDLLPARVECNPENGQLHLRLFETKLMGNTAKVLSYCKDSDAPPRDAIKHDCKHEQAVWVNLQGNKVQSMEARSSDLPPNNEMDWKAGWFFQTGKNIDTKIHEKVFLDDRNEEYCQISSKVKQRWANLIQDYRRKNQKELDRRHQNSIRLDKYLGKDPGQAALSPHLWRDDYLELREGMLCYAELRNDEVVRLFPVKISRRLQNHSPAELIDDDLKPASTMKELSPADRVFGWVYQRPRSARTTDRLSERSSYKGQLRIGAVTCTSGKEAIQSFPLPIPLAILAEPKPEQAKFYAAGDKDGSPMATGTVKSDGYADKRNNTIRGRKFYPHHKNLPENYWEQPTQDRTQDQSKGLHQEYRRVGQEKDSQNRSITDWVKPETTFVFSISVINLSDVELGALLWLLSREEEQYFRLGSGKPLGFGSVQLEIIDQTMDLRTGEDWQWFYCNFGSSLKVQDNSEKALATILTFQQAVSECYGKDFGKVPFIEAFMRSLTGFDDNLPLHYPRMANSRQAEEENFKWFEKNESANGAKVSLSALQNETGLPYFEGE